MPDRIKRQQLTVTGVVQGVGFRPFVHGRARHHRLAGFVRNTPAGVVIEIEGEAGELAAFANELTRMPPPLAVIRTIDAKPLAPTGEKQFVIQHSDSDGAASALISPDVAICDDCRRELFDPADRRYGYPFINCTNCGPRFTITRLIPYDRPNTAMAGFIMCRSCQAEYDDPASRRFHAQPNCCPACGPHLRLLDHAGHGLVHREEALDQAAQALEQGRIVAVKGLGGFHLAVDGTSETAVRLLRARKKRPAKPLAVMVGDLAAARGLCRLTADEEAALKSPTAPILLAERHPHCPVAPSVAPASDRLGVMLAYTPLHHLLLAKINKPLVMTSGNLSDEPIAIDNNEAVRRLGGIADLFLVHDRPILTRADDSVAIRLAGATRLFRRGRGLAPLPVRVNPGGPTVLALGAQLKNALCLLKGREALMSQHIGDLDNLAAADFFDHTIDYLQEIFQFSPERVVHDLHPDYLSSRRGQEQHLAPTLAVQHHHAHLAACLAENGAAGPAIGLIMDGTGYGTDSTIWGGEVLIGDFHGVRRYARFEPMALPGGDAAIREPWRATLGYLHQAYGGAPPDLPLVKDESAGPLLAQLAARLNCPQTSSCGRLFDVVAVLNGGCRRVSYEAQAAVELMQLAGSLADLPYPFVIRAGDAMQEVQVSGLIRVIVEDILGGADRMKVARRFHRTMVDLLVELAARARSDTGLATVALSGGVFQNHLLFEGLARELAERNFTVLTHRLVPTNDGGIALGQAMIGRCAQG